MFCSPDIPIRPSKVSQGVRYFDLIAEPVRREILPNIYMEGWGYNGCIPGPTLLVYPGEEVNIRVHNRLAESTSIHWHGLDVPNNMDGVPDVQPTPRIKPGEYFDYQFKIVNPPGTHFYHSHVNTLRQEMMGLAGGLIILDPYEKGINQDFFIMLQEFKLKGLEMGEVRHGTYQLNPLSHEFNFFTVNGRSFPYVSSLCVKLGERVRIRIANSSQQSHPMHIHGHQFMITASDGNPIQPNRQLQKNTVLVAPGETWDVEFIANNPGRWPFHCHIPHHMTNNFTTGSGGMFTTIDYVGI